MPILRDNESECVTVSLGEGDVSIGGGLLQSSDIGVLVFASQEKKDVGLKGLWEKGETVPVFKTPFRITFDNIECLDVVIGELNRVREYMTTEFIPVIKE